VPQGIARAGLLSMHKLNTVAVLRASIHCEHEPDRPAPGSGRADRPRIAKQDPGLGRGGVLGRPWRARPPGRRGSDLKRVTDVTEGLTRTPVSLRPCITPAAWTHVARPHRGTERQIAYDEAVHGNHNGLRPHGDGSMHPERGARRGPTRLGEPRFGGLARQHHAWLQDHAAFGQRDDGEDGHDVATRHHGDTAGHPRTGGHAPADGSGYRRHAAGDDVSALGGVAAAGLRQQRRARRACVVHCRAVTQGGIRWRIRTTTPLVAVAATEAARATTEGSTITIWSTERAGAETGAAARGSRTSAAGPGAPTNSTS